MILVTLITGFFASVTAITCGSLWLANRMDERDGEPEEMSSRKDSPEKLYPFEYLRYDISTCKLCGYIAKMSGQGPSAPRACTGRFVVGTDVETCQLKQSHVHVHCNTCGGIWAMAAAGS